MSKEHRLTLRLTEQQYTKLKQMAEESGNNMSSIIRDAVMEKVKP